MSWELAQRLTGGPRYYSIFEGGEIDPSYQIGSLEVYEFYSASWNANDPGKYHYTLSGTFKPRDEERYSVNGSFYSCDTLDELFDLLFARLAEKQRQAGPFHAVRCSHGAPG